MGRPKKRQRQEEDTEQDGRGAAQYPTLTVDRQDAFFDFQSQEQNLTLNESLSNNTSGNILNVSSIGPFDDHDELFSAFNAPIDQVDPSLDFK